MTINRKGYIRDTVHMFAPEYPLSFLLSTGASSSVLVFSFLGAGELAISGILARAGAAVVCSSRTLR